MVGATFFSAVVVDDRRFSRSVPAGQRVLLLQLTEGQLFYIGLRLVLGVETSEIILLSFVIALSCLDSCTLRLQVTRL